MGSNMSGRLKHIGTPFSRRNVIVGGAAGAVIVAAQTATAASARAEGAPTSPPAAAGDAGPSVAPIQGLDVRVLNAPLNAFSDVEFPVLVHVSDLEATSAVTVQFDGRIFDIYAVLRQGKKNDEIAFSRRAVGDIHFIDFTLNPEADGSPVSVALTAEQITKYPTEGIDSPLPTIWSVGAAVVATWTPTAPKPTSAWGIEVYPVWSDVKLPSIDGKNLYRYPTGARIVSVGPAESPAGLTMVAAIDSRLDLALDLRSAQIDGVAVDLANSRRKNGQYSASIPAIPAGKALDVVFDVDDDPAGVKLRSLQFAFVSVEPPQAIDAAIPRDTRRYAAVDLTPSGNANVDKAIEGTI